MLEIRDLNQLPQELRGGAVAIGNFDGVHQGHVAILRQVRKIADQLGGPAIAFSFDPHPIRVLRPEQAPPPITWTRRKAELVGEVGMDALVAYPTDRALLELEPEEFFAQIVRQQLDAKAMVEGTNFYFGKGRRGDVALLKSLCETNDMTLTLVDAVQLEGTVVSSSRIRRALLEGDVAMAATLLGRPYRIRGMVAHGAQRGASIGFPTANLQAIDTIMPGQGVYAGRAIWGGNSWPAAINIGPNPTFAEHQDKLEVHLLDFHESIYGDPLEVDFDVRLRDIQRFDGADALIEQLKNDVQRVRELTDK